MLSFFDGFRDINSATILFRMVFAILCGGAIGIERSIKNRPAGFRTHVLIIIGATTASLTGHFIYLNMSLPTDMSRLGAQVITGLGFIGAGTIIVTGQRTVKGLTTAAGLWATGIMGLAIGAGFYEGALLGTIAILFAEIVLGNIDINTCLVDDLVDRLSSRSDNDSDFIRVNSHRDAARSPLAEFCSRLWDLLEHDVHDVHSAVMSLLKSLLKDLS